MQLKYLKTLTEAQDTLSRVAGLTWSPNKQKLAVATADRTILLFDESGEKRDKFSTKPGDPANGKTSYVIKAISFSPDSMKLAVAQSDHIVYVYKLGEDWNDKKIICNKFPQPSAVASMIWLSTGPIVAGLDDGKVRVLQCKTNKSQNLFATDSSCIALVSNVRGTGFLTGHDDGSIVKYFVSDSPAEISGRVAVHPVAPFALAWLASGFAAAGCDKKIVFYDMQGRQSCTFDYSRDDLEREFMVASSSPNRQTVAFGSFDKIRVFTWSPRQNLWNENGSKEVKFLYSVTALVWRADGARLVIGSVCGATLLFEAVLRRKIWQDQFELTYVAPSQVLLNSLQNDIETINIESRIGLEIEDVRIMGKNKFLVARTDESLILVDLIRNLTSEVAWTASGHHERFYFDNPHVCLIFNAGELSLIEYGDGFILGSVRTEFVNPHVISVRLNERGETKDNKKLGYLLDMKTICVVDLMTNLTIAQISHDSKIDWIELSETGHKLLFRDKKLRLLVVDVFTGKKEMLQSKVAFVQWVPQSDVVVAQIDANMAIWYNIDMPNHVTITAVRGEILEINRQDGKTEVRTRDGALEHSYLLDEGLVEFGTAVNDSDFGRAVFFLETLGESPAAKAMWHNLATIALAKENLRVAQRCYAALGNASKTFYVSEMIKIEEKYLEEHGAGGKCPEVQARLVLLNADLKSAERIYVEQGDLDAAVKMYTDLGRWDDAIKFAERRGYAKLKELKDEQMSYLLSTNQEERAGQVLEERSEIDKAMSLYLKAKKPARAARLALKMPQLLENEEIVSRISAGLIKAELFELAGDLAQKTAQAEIAIQMYRNGGAYARAIELARYVSPDDVTMLEEEWGDWLVKKRQLDAAISHYIESGNTQKALDAAVSAKQWRKAVQIAKVLDDPDEIKKYALELAHHLSVVGDITGAEDLLIRAGMYREAVDHLNKYGQWEKAYGIAEKFLGATVVKEMFIEMAVKMEEEGKYRDAEKVLIAINEADQAINMYKKLEHYDSMIRLVERFHKEHLEATHIHLAQQLEEKGKLKSAEVHYLAADDWKAAVHMYCSAGKWSEAYRVAKQKDGDGASSQVAYMWSRSLPVEGAARLLTKMGLLNVALGFACDSGQYDYAFELCAATDRSPEDIHLKRAMSLEDEGKFSNAEEEFLLANKPREAISMYTHSGDWRSALRIAEKHVPDKINDILIGQAGVSLQMRNYQEYEALMIRAERPDQILQYYKEFGMWDDAMRIAREYVPSALAEIQRIQSKANRSEAGADSKYLLEQASDYAREEQFRKAADCLLEVKSHNASEVTVERALMRAAEICNQFLDGTEAMEVARELGPRLVEINQIGPAAQLFLAAELPKEAVDVFIQSENWSKARRLAKEIDPQLVVYVEAQQKMRLRTEGNVEQLADIDIAGALDLLAEQGQWTRCIEKARQHSGQVMHKYLALYAAQLIRDGDSAQALALYLNYGAPANQSNFNIYKRIAQECFALREPDAAAIWKDLRQFLYQVTQAIRSSDESSSAEVSDRFDQLLLIAHYYAARAACRQVQALKMIAVKISVALLRFTDLLPVDKGFYEAGMDLRELGRESEAFVIFNHYLDICEAIDEGSGNLVDHSDLACTDFPSSVPIPAEMHLRNELAVHEEIREWVLAVSMDQQVDQALPVDDRNLFESSLGKTEQACVVSGYPIVGKQSITFQRTHRMASRDAWSKLSVAAKMAPHTDVPDVIDFIEKWCGPAVFVN